MKLYKYPVTKEIVKVTSCLDCPLKFQQSALLAPSNIIIHKYPVCLGIRIYFEGRYGQEGYHPSIGHMKKHGNFLPDCPLEDAPEVKNEVV